MPLPKGITVEVLVGDRAIPFYDDPDAEEKGEPAKHTRYVEAITGVGFKLRLSVNEKFTWGDLTTALRISAFFDGAETGCSRDFNRSWRRSSYTIDRIPVFCESSKQWKIGSLSFGALLTDEVSNTKIAPAQLQDLGSIKIIAQQIVYTEEPRRVVAPTTAQRISRISEMKLKGKLITNTVDYVNMEPAKTPCAEAPATPIAGSMGKGHTLYILYRSRGALQSVGCIPRSPSPEVSDEEQSTTSHAEQSGEHDRQEQIRSLRARRALLERNSNVTPRRNGTTRVKREGDVSEIKAERKRARQPEYVDLTERKRRRPSGKVEYVDLTAD